MPNVVVIILEMILSGYTGTISPKKVPMTVRVLLAGVLLTVYVALFALLLLVGMQDENVMLIVAAFILLLSSVTLVFLKMKEIKRR